MNDCRSCRHSIGMKGVWLWCTRYEREAKARCEGFEYEPGTDANEVQSSAPISDPLAGQW